MRLSASSFAGTARTLVAVGSCSDAVMFLAMAFAAPRSGLVVSTAPLPAPGCADFAGLVVPAAGLPVASVPEPVLDDVVGALVTGAFSLGACGEACCCACWDCGGCSACWGWAAC